MTSSEPAPSGTAELVTNVPHHLGRVAAAEAVSVEHTGGPAEVRAEAVRGAVADVAAGGSRTEPVLAVRHHRAEGMLVLALGGRFDADAVDRLRGQFAELRRLATTELVIDCTHLAECGTELARGLGELRREVLAGGASVELSEAPERVVAELAAGRAEAPTRVDT